MLSNPAGPTLPIDDITDQSTTFCALNISQIYNEERRHFSLVRNQPRKIVERVASDIENLLAKKRKALDVSMMCRTDPPKRNEKKTHTHTFIYVYMCVYKYIYIYVYVFFLVFFFYLLRVNLSYVSLLRIVDSSVLCHVFQG